MQTGVSKLGLKRCLFKNRSLKRCGRNPLGGGEDPARFSTKGGRRGALESKAGNKDAVANLKYTRSQSPR